MGNKADPLSAPRDDELEQIRTQLHALIGDQIKKADPDASLTVLGAGRDDVEPGRNFLSVLDQGGWSVPNWPVEYGGRGVAPSEVALISRALFDFEQPDLEQFPCLKLSFEALRSGQGACISLNAANEIAVASFLDGKLSYTRISALIENTLTWHAGRPPWALNSLEDVMALDAEVRRQAAQWISP